VDEDRRDPETGQYTPDFTDDELLQALEEREPAGTVELADVFNCSQPGAYQRLTQLEEKGLIESKLVGGTKVWMLK
jgi:predicted ArsR family transcriptional regulator